MSLIKSIMHQLGLSGDPAKNFTLSVPAAPDGTMKLARGNAGATTQDIMTVDAASKVAFPAMSSDISSNGSIEFPGGLIMKWGFVTTEVDGPATVNFPTAFPNACLNVTGTVVAAGSSAGAGQPFLYNSPSVSSVMIGALTSDTGGWASRTVFWQALGN